MALGFHIGRHRRGVSEATGAGRWATSTRMRKMRLFLLLALVWALPVATHAQWLYTKTEHDWRLTIGGYSFGLVQKAIHTYTLNQPSYRETTIYLGPVYTTTRRCRAPCVAALLLLPAGTAGAALMMWLWPRKRET